MRVDRTQRAIVPGSSFDLRDGRMRPSLAELLLMGSGCGAGGWALGWFVEGVANGVAREHQLYAAVLGAAFGGVVRGDRLVFAEAVSFDIVRRNSLLHEVIAHGLGTALGKCLVVFVAANAVRVSFDRHMQARVGENNA